MDRLAIARMLREIGTLLEIRGGEPYRARAYERGARALEALPGDLGPLIARDRLTEIPGIGPALAATIREIDRTGRSEQLDRLRRELPPGVIELIQVPGLTLPRITALHEALGIRTVEDLRRAVAAGRVRAVKGFGPAVEARILAGLQERETRGARTLLHRALAEGEALLAHARGGPGIVAAELAGAVRRRVEAVDRLVLVVATDGPAPALDHCLAYPPALAPLARTDELAAARLAGGLLLEVHAAPARVFAGRLHALTGSDAHRAQLAARAVERGLALDGLGLVRRRDRRRLPVNAEPSLYRHLDLPFLPPELREGAGEVEAALAGDLPAELVEERDVQGAVHCHTVYSDGANTVEEMARAARALGMRYITITDHSPTASYAGGLGLDRLARQWEEIARAQERVPGITILRGTECDILPDGRLDYPDEVLARFDVVIASIHNRHRMDEAQMTRRLVTAMRHPCFKIWGHALGRYVLRRPPIACRVEEVLDAAAESRVAIEVNGNPHRLDLEPRWQREARRRGLRFVVSTDAHSVTELEHLRYGIYMARRGWLARGDVLNTWPVEAFRATVRPA